MVTLFVSPNPPVFHPVNDVVRFKVEGVTNASCISEYATPPPSAPGSPLSPVSPLSPLAPLVPDVPLVPDDPLVPEETLVH